MTVEEPPGPSAVRIVVVVDDAMMLAAAGDGEDDDINLSRASWFSLTAAAAAAAAADLYQLHKHLPTVRQFTARRGTLTVTYRYYIISKVPSSLRSSAQFGLFTAAPSGERL